MSEEKALVIHSQSAFELGVKPGFTVDHGLASLLTQSTDKMEFMARSKAEFDPSWLQLIPYCVLINDAGLVFAYERDKSGGESRLHRKISIGVGGHINPIDSSGEGSEYSAGLCRELAEEVDVDPEMSIGDPVALIYDDQNEVGRVHLGVVHIVDIGASVVHPNEPSIANPRMASIDSLFFDRGRMENWSQLCVQFLGTREEENS